MSEAHMAMRLLQHLDIASLPSREVQEFEYKSSKVRLDDLKVKLGCAAAAFWNSGGGTFIAGVDDGGKPDGGVPASVGRSPIRDWVDQVLHEVAPVGPYAVELFDPKSAARSVAPDPCILAVGFGASSRPPHMAPDRKYYLRAGAHTVPATHFLVEALWAKRSVQHPQLIHSLRLKPEVSGVIQLAVLALTDQPALNVTISLNPLPAIWRESKSFPVRLPVLDRTTPFYLDIATFANADQQLQGIQLRAEYQDLAQKHYDYVAALDISAIAPWTIGTPASEKMAKSIESIEKALREVPKALEGLQREGTELRGRIEAYRWAAVPGRQVKPLAVAEGLSADAAKLLREAGTDGSISLRVYIGGSQLVAGSLQVAFGPNDARKKAEWRGVIAELFSFGLVEGVFQPSGSGYFHVTKLGYEVADATKPNVGGGEGTDSRSEE